MKLIHTPRFLPCLTAVATLTLMTPLAHAQMTDEGTGAGPQNEAVDVNDAGVVIGNALSSTNMSIAYVAVTTGNEVPLAALANDACSASSLNNNGSTAQIVGACDDANGVSQAVEWYANTPATAPTVLRPLPGLLGLGAGVRTRATAQNIQGSVVGVSITTVGTRVPAIWPSGVASPSLLPVGLLGIITPANCVPTDVSDPIVANSDEAAIVGECPTDGSGTGRPIAVIWPDSSDGAQPLPLPAGAQYCVAEEVNVNGYVLGTCVYATDGYQTVRWSYPWTAAPIVLQTVSGTTVPRNSGVDMNATGQITGNYLAAGGFTLPYCWDPTATGTAGVTLTALSGGSTASASGIGNNGEVVGAGETSGGNSHAFHSLMCATPTDDGTLPGGNNSGANGISPSGMVAEGWSEGTGEAVHSEVQSLSP